MSSMRTLLIAVIFANISACSLSAMNQDFYPDEPALLGDRDATYTYMVDAHGKRQQKVINPGIFEFCDVPTKQLFNCIIKNDQKKLKNLLDESAIKGNLNLNAELYGLRAMEVAMREKNYNAACILLLYGANIEHVRCRQHRALLRRLKIQAKAIAAHPPRAQSDNSDQFGQSPAQSEDSEDNEIAVVPAAQQPEDYEVEAAQEAAYASLDRQDPKSPSNGYAYSKVDVGCHQSLMCSIQ